ncbi:MAG: serine/threonine-protein kinase [Rubrivivax sp.]|jgi:hypothetical protein
MSHPTQLGKYQITEILGEGAMGVVYKGFDPDIRRVVALKTIRQALAGQSAGASGIAARFRNEAQAAGRLSHPGIVQVYDYGQQEDVAFIAMEFVEGHSLAHYLSHRVRFKDEDIPGLMSQVLDALHHAHEAGVWHRDIKPANVILGRNGRLKIADFGVARIEDAGLTQMHTLIGTPAYMAPEQFRGDPIDRRVDLYAAGVLLYTLLVGHPPFSGSTEALMYKVVHEAPQLPSKVDGANRPRFYDAIIANALAKDPNRRYATAEDFKAALERGVGEPIDTTAWEQTLVHAAVPPVPPPIPLAPTPSGVGQMSQGSAPTHWDRAQLAGVEQSLARFVGPMATVLVRKMARDCVTLEQLYAKLAEHVTNPAAKAQFLNEGTALRTVVRTHGDTSGTRTALPGGTRGATSLTGLVAGSGAAGPFVPSEAFKDGARKVLAQHVGPIATVVVKNVSGKATSREQFMQMLAEAAPPPVRAKVLADLAKLV